MNDARNCILFRRENSNLRESEQILLSIYVYTFFFSTWQFKWDIFWGDFPSLWACRSSPRTRQQWPPISLLLLMTTEEKWLFVASRHALLLHHVQYNSSNFFIVNLLVIYSAEEAEDLAPSRFLPGGQTSFGKAMDIDPHHHHLCRGEPRSGQITKQPIPHSLSSLPLPLFLSFLCHNRKIYTSILLHLLEE